MAKGTSDLILRDRLQFTLDATGDQTTVYGRFDLSEFVSTLDRKGLSIKEIQFMLRDDSRGNTGNFLEIGNLLANASQSNAQISDFKIYATTRAYENAADVGIASPDVLCVETWQAVQGPNITVEIGGVPTVGSGSSYAYVEHTKYGTPDLHPDGFPVVTDLLFMLTASFTQLALKMIPPSDGTSESSTPPNMPPWVVGLVRLLACLVLLLVVRLEQLVVSF